jgi:2-hydroxy-6-oxonona-2,4-dienedioate hydrolase
MSLRGYAKDMRRLRERVAAVPTQRLETAFGTVEYAERGSGNALLVSHGIMGGHAVALDMAETYFGPDFHVIAPSRFGYFGSTLPRHASAADQADVYAMLLDHLDVQRAAVFGSSAGSSSAIQLALRHPDRVAALLLGMANLPPVRPPAPLIAPLLRAAYGWDWAFWTLKALMPKTFRMLVGIPRDFAASPDEQATINHIAESMFPMRPRRRGAAFDALISNPAVNDCPLEAIDVPTLLVHAPDDAYGGYDKAVDAARRIPGARLATIPRGGHVFVGAEPEVRRRISAFLGSFGLP